MDNGTQSKMSEEKHRIVEAGKDSQWKKGQSGNPAGRPKKIYTILKESGYGASDVRTAFGEVAFMTEEDINKLLKKKDTPIILKTIGKAYIEASKNGEYRFVKEILDQFMGKAIDRKELGAGGAEKITISFKE